MLECAAADHRLPAKTSQTDEDRIAYCCKWICTCTCVFIFVSMFVESVVSQFFKLLAAGCKQRRLGCIQSLFILFLRTLLQVLLLPDICQIYPFKIVGTIRNKNLQLFGKEENDKDMYQGEGEVESCVENNDENDEFYSKSLA